MNTSDPTADELREAREFDAKPRLLHTWEEVALVHHAFPSFHWLATDAPHEPATSLCGKVMEALAGPYGKVIATGDPRATRCVECANAASADLARLLASRRTADAAARTTGMRDMATAIVASLTGLLPLLREGAVRAQWRDDPHACLALVIETIKARHVDGVRDLVAALAPPALKETP